MTYSQSQEHYDHVFGSQYDDVRERYASELEDIKAMERADFYEMEYRHLVTEAGFPDTLDGMDEYEAMWKRTFEYAQSGAIDDLLEDNA
jgi:hypothetical protein